MDITIGRSARVVTMDLRSMLNTSEGGASRSAQASTPAKPPPPPGQQPPMPSTPVQAVGPSQPFRDYGQPVHASPGRSLSRDYAPHQPPSGVFASPPPYAAPGPYGSRPAPPPLQPLASAGAPSPGSASMAGPSPYRPTPTSSLSAVSGGYPFPAQPTPASPVQRHQYPPTSAYPQRDSFSQQVAPGGITGPPGHPSYMQGQPIPQTPPVGTPGGAHPYLHQRSQSTHSTPTPTSAQSQQHYGTPYGQGSPIVSHHAPPQPHEPVRHPSQPPTPLGPPLSAASRAPPTPSGFPQPTSPYQHRVSAPAVPYPQALHRSPPPLPSSSLPRQANYPAVYEAHPADAHRRSQSQSDRGRSTSVSPKTRLPSLPAAGSFPPQSVAEPDPRHKHPVPAPAMDNARSRAVTPAKRKLDDRDLQPDELKREEHRPPPYERVNGAHAPRPASHQTTGRPSTSQALARKKPTRYAEPPPWARRYEDRTPLNKPNFVVRKPGQHGSVNGRVEAPPEHRVSRQTSPETVQAAPRAPALPSEGDLTLAQLGSWEECLTGQRPSEAIPRAVADFLYLRVIHEQDIAEIASRGAHFEIEAKLGTLVDRDTNQRIVLPVSTECIISDTARVTFRSSMTGVRGEQGTRGQRKRNQKG